MTKFLTLSLAGLAAACLMLVTPSLSHAQGYGPGNGGYGPAAGGYGGYSPGPSLPGGYGNGGYGQGYGQGNGQGYGGYGGYSGYGRPPIVHPQYEHWTPGRGWHEHGHIHVPHRGHVHTRPY